MGSERASGQREPRWVWYATPGIRIIGRRHRRAGRVRALALFAGVSGAQAIMFGTDLGSRPHPAEPGAAGQWVQVETPGSPSLLRVPRDCAPACALVVVSHPRGQSAAHLRGSAGVSVLTGALEQAGFAVLLSGDGGTTSWGSPAGLNLLGSTHAQATRLFPWSGRTYALGLSMGGLMALRSALPGSPYPVQGVALIDGWVDLQAAFSSATSRRQEITAAYGHGVVPDELNPALLARRWGPLPLLVVGGPDDKTVPFARNGEELWGEVAAPGLGGMLRLRGAHLGANRFTPTVAQRLVGFYQSLEGRQ